MIFPFTRAVGLGLAGMLTASFSQSATPQEQQEPAPVSAETQIKKVLPTYTVISEEEMVDKAVADFRTDFTGRVARNDKSGIWNDCFTTIDRRGQKITYELKKVQSLRRFDAEPVVKKVMTAYMVEANDMLKLAPLTFKFNEVPIPKITKPIVVVDFGHGENLGSRRETGANESGVTEAKVAETVGMKLSEILRQDYGAIVVNTRSPIGEAGGFELSRATRFSNQEKSLQIRAETANYLREMFPETSVTYISLHTNRAVGLDGNDITGIHGGLVFSYSPNENGASGSPESRKLARFIASNYSMRRPTEMRTNDYAVLRCQNEDMAAVLLEMGFNTNPGDRGVFSQILASDTVANKYAFQIAEGIGSYLRNKTPKPLEPEMRVAMN